MSIQAMRIHRHQFQFTPPRGGRPARQAGDGQAHLFQFTPPRGGRLIPKTGGTMKSKFQFTPPRGGRLLSDMRKIEAMFISIHAPAWGATSMIRYMPRKPLFQFTPPRGGRRPSACTSWLRRYNFNSRPRVGGDSTRPLSCIQCGHISIHAPAWGATFQTESWPSWPV